jgi:hypothetical protein
MRIAKSTLELNVRKWPNPEAHAAAANFRFEVQRTNSVRVADLRLDGREP